MPKNNETERRTLLRFLFLWRRAVSFSAGSKLKDFSEPLPMSRPRNWGDGQASL